MHRSGTSLVASVLGRCGLDLGDDLLSPDVGNPLGYFEDVSIHDLHLELLSKAGIGDGFTVTDDHLPIPVDDVFRARAHDIVADRAAKPQWGWKEPRTALFLDLWAEAIPDATFLFLFRRPAAVVDSLLRRATNASVNEDPGTALTLWRIYNERMLLFSKTQADRCVWFDAEAFTAESSRLIDALRDRGFELANADVRDVFVEDAFHTDVRMRARSVLRKNRREAQRCAELYEELRTLAR
jgi:hypothetical protein